MHPKAYLTSPPYLIPIAPTGTDCSHPGHLVSAISSPSISLTSLQGRRGMCIRVRVRLVCRLLCAIYPRVLMRSRDAVLSPWYLWPVATAPVSLPDHTLGSHSETSVYDCPKPSTSHLTLISRLQTPCVSFHIGKSLIFGSCAECHLSRRPEPHRTPPSAHAPPANQACPVRVLSRPQSRRRWVRSAVRSCRVPCGRVSVVCGAARVTYRSVIVLF